MKKNSQSNNFLLDIGAVLVIIALGIKVLWGIKKTVDIQMTDDTGYMTLAGFFPKNLLVIQFGPLYTSFIKFIQIFESDPINVYYILLSIMSFLPAIAIYCFLRKVGNLPIVWAMLLAIFYLFSTENLLFATWSRISHFAISITLFGLCFIEKETDTAKKIFKGIILLFVLGFIRPEYHVGLFLFILFAIVYWYINKEQIALDKKMKTKALLFFGFLFLFSLFLSPLKGSRSYEAFAQQFAFNYCEWNKLSYYHFVDWEIISFNTFGKFRKLSQAYFANPEVFQHHILYNFQQYIFKAANAIRELLLPSRVVRLNNFIAAIILSVIAFGALFFSSKHLFDRFKKAISAQIIMIAIIFALTLPSIAASIVYYTREHYRILAVPFFYFLVVFVLRILNIKNTKHSQILGFICLFFTVVFSPKINDYTTKDLWHTYTKQSNLPAILKARSLNIKDTIVNTNHEGGFNVFIQPYAQNVDPRKKEEYQPFSAFILQQKINSVYYTTAYDYNFRYKNDTSWHHFLKNPEDFGFKKFDIENTKSKLYFKKNIL